MRIKLHGAMDEWVRPRCPVDTCRKGNGQVLAFCCPDKKPHIDSEVRFGFGVILGHGTSGGVFPLQTIANLVRDVGTKDP